MVIGTATILGPAVRQNPVQWHLVGFKERDHLIIEQIRRRQGGFPIVELGEGYLTLGINEGLLINPAHALQGPDREGILRATRARTFALKLPMRFFLHLRLL